MPGKSHYSSISTTLHPVSHSQSLYSPLPISPFRLLTHLLQYTILTASKMPVTLTTASHAPRKWWGHKATSSQELLKDSCPHQHEQSKWIIQSSFNQQLQDSHITPSQHGFVRAVFHAYSSHHHLVLRPEDVWFSILTQLNFFINAHAEELRSLFVAHEGRKDLTVTDPGTIDSADLGKLAVLMTEVIEENILDPELRTWIMPAFSTTTDSDRVVAAISMMGAMQKYFSYTMCLRCGIPSVTLLGEREDWEQMVKKLDKIPQFGSEPALFAQLLRPVLEHFVASFDNPSSPGVLEFWNRCAHKLSGGSGPIYLSGWITAFCFWDEDGKSLCGNQRVGRVAQEKFAGYRDGCELDGVLFHNVETDDIPLGASSVPVKLNDNGDLYETKMLAGMVGIQATSSGQTLDNSYTDDPAGPGLDTIRPVSGWWMYELRSEAEMEALNNEEKDW